MVSIDYRLYSYVTNEQILEFFKSLGYFYLGIKEKSIKKGEKWISAHEFIKVLENGRFHFFLEFSKKSSGFVPSPQVDIHAHFDIFKIKADKEIHVTRRNVQKDLDEMFNIHRALKNIGYGYMEYKSRNSAHDTIRKGDLKFLKQVLDRDYIYENDGKFKNIISNGQITVQIIEQRRYSHIVCVYVMGNKPELFREKAQKELIRIMSEVFEFVEEDQKLIKELNIKIKQNRDKLEEVQKNRDLRNSKTKELISCIKELEIEMERCKNRKNEKTLLNKKKRTEIKLIKNKKIANKYHKEYLTQKNLLKKLKKQKKSLKS